ncbi:MAG: Dps family protein [Gammaproteobacteria bacterium]
MTMSDREHEAVTDALTKVLADTYTLYLKTHNFHWNVTGPNFHSLHTMFEEHYTDMALAVDEIAERIRALGEYAPGSYKAFAELSSIKEAEGRPKAKEMVITLAGDHDKLVNTMRAAIEAAEAVSDQPTADMLIARTQLHQKYTWMLRSTLE